MSVANIGKTMTRMMKNDLQKGFTSIELIIVILVLGVLAGSVIISNPFSISDYSGFAADQVIADIQYVQMKAMGLGKVQSITFNPGSVEYTISGESEIRKIPQDKTNNTIVITGTNFSAYSNRLFFNSLGEPCLSTVSPPASCTTCDVTTGCTVGIGTGSIASKTLKIHAITGNVR